VFGSIGMQELLLILLVVLLLFGAKRLPELARGLGKGIREFNKAAKDVKDEFKMDELDEDLKG
jgi:sec-independent protein translocase protein TatA